ncbi:M4 family metallopeptidase [Streptomyces sp. F63]|uniref:M4 family metallopeptidase n=1 Tax=Streptomyces sp. F63 TaxID=2824887 RepID=UPI001B3987E1|nr:M4 family metallopeptidase [Streptomyces sp. F63]MBQ0984579.1 M4 family metallopeptidase [Streptomyces sp. F63]
MRPTPRAARRRSAACALITTAAMLAVGVQTSPASAAPRPDKDALPVSLSPAKRADLLKDAAADAAKTADTLKLGGKEKLRVRDVVQDRDGTTHTRYERTYAGLPVLGGDLVVHESKSGKHEGVTKATSKPIKVPTTRTKVSATTAKKKALTTAKDEAGAKAIATGAPRKVIWAGGKTPVLAWETVTGGLQEDGTPNEFHVVTDATTGKELRSWQGVHQGTGNSQYAGQVTLGTSPSYTLTDSGRGDHKTYDMNNGTSGSGSLFTDADDVWGDGTPGNRQTAAVDAHYGAALTWDYYKEVHGRSGIRGDGVGARTRVHYGNAYVNAFWQDSCFCMTYGDGDGNAKPLTSIDVAAHEMTHGVTSATANLTYSGESGGLNEATSDIFAAAVEFHAGNTTDVADYLVGEKIDIRGNGTPLRYMDEPSKDGSSKDYWYSGIGGVDVHYSSGVANHFFYLLSEGSGAKTINGVQYDSPTYDGLPVTGIGIGNAEKIWFKALTEYMTSSTNYAGARTATLQAAADLFGAGSATHEAVAHAWAAVNVGARPGGGGGTGDTYDNTADVAIPDAGSAVTSSITISDQSGNAPSNLQVGVDIVHTYRGDLVIDLIAPDGTSYRLKDSGWDSADNVNETYTVNASSESANGTWKLSVQDVYSQDTGYINSWSLTF